MSTEYNSDTFPPALLSPPLPPPPCRDGLCSWPPSVARACLGAWLGGWGSRVSGITGSTGSTSWCGWLRPGQTPAPGRCWLGCCYCSQDLPRIPNSRIVTLPCTSHSSGCCSSQTDTLGSRRGVRGEGGGASIALGGHAGVTAGSYRI